MPHTHDCPKCGATWECGDANYQDECAFSNEALCTKCWATTSSTVNPEIRGCTTSFLMQERGEIGGVCEQMQPDPKEEYVQPDKEREAGGEG